MKFRNPWIDPRILQVRPEAVQAYLLAHGWKSLGPSSAPDLLMFDTPEPREDKPNVLLPTQMVHGHQIQRMIELVSEVALYEDRWAVDVLSDMLRQPADQSCAPAHDGSPANGPTVSSRTEPAPR